VRWTRSAWSSQAPVVESSAGPPPGAEGFWASVHRVLPIMRATMEFCWLYPWVVVIGGGLYGGGAPLLGPGWALALLLGGQSAMRPVLNRAHTLRGARAILVGGGLALGLVAIHQHYYRNVPLWQPAWIGAFLRAVHDVLPAVPKPVSAAFVAACLWWRGLILGGREVGPFDVDQAYKTGVGMVVAYLITAAIYPDTSGFASAGPELPVSMMAFFFIGLCALALARLATIWGRGRPEERAQVPGRGWLVLVVGVAGMILFAASAMAGLAAADVSRYLVLGLRPLLPVLEVIFIVLFFVAGIIVRVLVAILSRIPRRDVPETGQVPSVFDDLLRRLREIDMSPHVVEGARWGMVVGLLVLLIIAMAVTIVLVKRRDRKTDDDERESVWSTRAWLAGMGGLIPRFGGGAQTGERPLPEVTAIRRIYRELLSVGTGLGAPRHAWVTPQEHVPRLRGVLPQATSEVQGLTRVYERVRYGAWRPRREELRDAEAALDRVRATVETTASSEERSK